MSLYERINEEELLIKDLTIPEYFPAIYIDQYDKVYCYLGVISKDRVSIHSSPYYIKGKKSGEIKKYLRGYFRIENGIIVADNEFIDEKNYFNDDKKCKIIPAYPHFPVPQDMTFSIYSNKYKELEDELTRKVFGLTYKELLELLYCFNNIFEIADINTYYQKYPSITRSIRSNNYCDLSTLWIPEEYPYIAFQESGYIYSHISLYGFYKTIKFITKDSIESPISKKMLENGLKQETLENLFKIKNDLDFNSTAITKDYYYKLLDESKDTN